MMDIETCLKKLGYVGVLDFATVDEDGVFSDGQGKTICQTAEG